MVAASMATIALSQISPASKDLTSGRTRPRFFLPSLLHKTPIRNPKSLVGFVVFAKGNGSRRNGGVEGEEASGAGARAGDGDLRRDQRPAFNLRWRDLLYPDPENMVAVGLTGLLTWASAQVLCQLFFITIAILFAALKYSFIAALLLFILITLL